jgi:hypothetical protein
MNAHAQATYITEESTSLVDQPETVSSEAVAVITSKEELPDPSARPSEKREITPEERYRMISELAYFKAEKRGFVPGHEEKDWLEAEKEFEGISEYWID